MTKHISFHRQAISIHALRGEGDQALRCQRVHAKHFNPRPPWGGRRGYIELPRTSKTFQSTPSVGRATRRSERCFRQSRRFQSTPSVGRATVSDLRKKSTKKHFNPRPPWGGRHEYLSHTALILAFQSTPSVGRATTTARALTVG